MIYLDSLIENNTPLFQHWRKNNPVLEHVIDNELKEQCKNIKYVYLRRCFLGEYQENSDLFAEILPSSLNRLIYEKDVILIFDTFFEGDSNLEFPLLKALHHNCERYGVDPKKIFYMTSNEKDPNFYHNLCEQNLIKDRITICAYSFFEIISRGQYVADIGPEQDARTHFLKCKEDAYKHYKNKFFASLSNKLRIGRIEATFLLCQSSIREYGLISHNIVDDIEIINELTKKYGVKFTEWLKELPLIIDNPSAEDLFLAHTVPFNQTLFHITNETFVSTYNNTCQFISEKTFRPILNAQPFIIFGQVNVHKWLENKGYKLFHNIFDYSFDSEPDHVIRYEKLLNTVTDAVEHLKGLSKEEQLAWRFDNESILVHNLMTLRNEDSVRKVVNDSLRAFLKNNNLGD